MYEQIMISKILDLRDTSMLSEQGLHTEMFLNTQAEINFILAHESKYRCVPDHATFVAEFPDFELYSSNEDIGFISEKIKDNFLYPKLYKVIQDSANSLTTSSIDTLKSIEDAISDIKENEIKVNVRDGKCIISQKSPDKRNVAVVDLSGCCLVSTTMSDVYHVMTLKAGLYVVKVDGKSYKILVP